MKRQFVLALLLIVSGSLLASFIQTDAGRIDIRDIRFKGSAGQQMSALLYIPENATQASPQPAVLAIHGYINSRETQSGFAIEFARRGFVVLALDQSGHGYSDPPAFAHGFGGPDGLRYLHSLPFVDKQRIGLEGHSMGGWASLMAASALPEYYHAVVLEGSSTGTFGTAEGTTEYPKNLLLVFSQYDEFSELMWGAITAPGIISTPKLKTLFGTDNDIEIGRIYGNVESSSARKLAMPAVTHPGDHLSREAIGEAVQWFQQILKPELALQSDMQTWYWKELGTLIALLGLILMIFPIADMLLSSGTFASLSIPLSKNEGLKGMHWLAAASAFAFIPIVTYFYFQNVGAVIFPANSIWSQSVTNNIIVWMLGNGAISALLFGIWLKFGQQSIMRAEHCGLGNARQAGHSFIFAFCIVAILYLVAVLVHLVFLIDFRFWVIALKLMSKVQLFQFIAYLPATLVFFLMLSTALHTQLRSPGNSLRREMVLNALVLSTGFVCLLLIQYLPLLAGGSLTIAEPLLTIIAWQFVPLMIIVGFISTWLFERTGSIYPGAFTNALFITWYIVAGQATQAVPFFS